MQKLFSDKLEFPKVGLIKQEVQSPRIDDVKQALLNELEKINLSDRISSGEKVGITVGSRGIANLSTIIKLIAQEVQEVGGKPFIIPSMGSHGGGTAEGQLEVLESLGITEESMGIPIKATSKVIELGQTKDGLPVFVNEKAITEADKLVLFNRVKPHTEYRGENESGLIKMCAIGLGNPRGAKTVHQMALDYGYEKTIREVGQYILDKLPIAFGLATVENYYYETSDIKAVPPENLLREERELLKVAKNNLGMLPFSNLDVLIVDEIGKNISGAGFDTNVIGRIMVYGQEEPEKPNIKRIVVLGLSEESHGNAAGIGLADFTTEKVVEGIDRQSTYLNCITAQTPEKARVPPYFSSEKRAIEAALRSIGYVQPPDARLVHITNTEIVENMEVSTVLWKEAQQREDLTTHGTLSELQFDEDGNLKRV